MNLEKLMEEKNAVLEVITEKCQKLEAENKRLRETLEGIISCAENVRVTYADSNQLIIEMARQARKDAGDE
jgi:prefoldin subunit 5